MIPRSGSSSSSDSDSLAERLLPSSSDRKSRIPKKIHKAEREKLKRDHLNELFQALGQTLEPTRQNNGKASILGDASKLLQDLIGQVESLRRENATLEKESRYVTVERNELKDENFTLGAEIENLQTEIRERMQSNAAWTGTTSGPITLSHPVPTSLPIQRPPVVTSMFPAPHDQLYMELSGDLNTSHPTLIRRPHARYPTLTDPWTYQILSSQQYHPVDGNDGSSTATGDGEAGVPSSPKELQLLI